MSSFITFSLPSWNNVLYSNLLVTWPMKRHYLILCGVVFCRIWQFSKQLKTCQLSPKRHFFSCFVCISNICIQLLLYMFIKYNRWLSNPRGPRHIKQQFSWYHSDGWHQVSVLCTQTGSILRRISWPFIWMTAGFMESSPALQSPCTVWKFSPRK